MSILIDLAALLSGYLLGSISFARIVTAVVSPDTDLRGVAAPVEGSEEKLHMSSISATSVRLKLGARYGCLTSFLDMVKVGLPVAFFEFVLSAQPAAYFAAIGGLLGHNWPIFYGFQGGYGHSAMYGALFVLNWMAVPLNFFGTALLYGVLRQVQLALFGGVVLLVPWLWYSEGGILPVGYAVIASGAYLIKILPDFFSQRAIEKESAAGSPEEAGGP